MKIWYYGGVKVILAILPLCSYATRAHTHSSVVFQPVVFLPLIGMSLSYLLSCIPQLRLTSGARRTVAIETSIQNGNLSNNIVFLTYADNLTLFTSAVPITMLYAVAQSFYNVIMVFGYKAYRMWKTRHEEKDTVTLQSTVSYQNMDDTDIKE